MIKEAIATAATRDEAIEKAKAQLNAPLDADVKFEILQEAQKKILGFIGGKDAKVRAYYEVADEPAKKPVQEKKKPEVKKPAQEPAKAEMSSDTSVDKDIEAVKAYLMTILNGMAVKDVTISTVDEGEETVFEIGTSESFGAIIGRHGETLDAIQYLVRLFANKNTQSQKKVSLNVGDYREKRAESLKALAARSASQVLKYGRNAKLEPMNPYERRIVHTAVQSIEGVTSHSVGYDTERRVIITLEEGVQPTHGDRRRGGYNRGGNNGRRGGGRQGGRSGGYKPSVPSDRAPKNDTAGTRYGKIEVKKTTPEN